MLQVRSNRTLGARLPASAEEQISKTRRTPCATRTRARKRRARRNAQRWRCERADVGDEAVSSGERDEETEIFGARPPARANGLAVVYETFPAKYRARQGEGHEAHDFNLLISMYKEWAIKMYPYAPADETLARVDKLGKDKACEWRCASFTRDFGGGVGEAVAAMERVTG